MSAVGTILLQSPGCNEGKARYETLGIHEPKVISSSFRSGTITQAFILRLGSAAPLGLNKCVPIINPGLAPWAMQECRPYRAALRLPYHFTILMLLPRASASKSRLITSAVGTTLLQSPGCNEGKARYETLGIHEPKVISSSFRSGTITRAFVLRLGSAAPLGLNKCIPIISPRLKRKPPHIGDKTYT